ncbi:MAG: 3-methyl-2-oxobutanoate dehydrogenase subunit VorB [Anaerolineales bacterium]|nr:3-methyl-2-oxobutanoate dehydrogenase subunit VorB [Anaerolineales bacterium]
MTYQLLKGNEAMAEAAVRAGANAYFGYPITPQTELLEYLSRRMPELNRAFLQAESEVAAINMVYGAASAGARVFTSSSSPGISLMMEGVSYIIGSEVPAVIIDVMRGGPGLGNIAPAQSDYFQIVKGGGHGDYHPLVLAPATVQEAVDLTYLAFDLAEKYRTVVVILADGCIGQMMEPAQLPPMREPAKQAPEWALTGAAGRDKRVVSSIYLIPENAEKFNQKLQAKQREMTLHEVRFHEYQTDDAEWFFVGFGTAGRVAQSAVKQARAQGLKVGLHRPISLFPFPEKRLAELAQRARGFLVVEMNCGQMVEDVRLAVAGKGPGGATPPVKFFGRAGGVVPLPDEVLAALKDFICEGAPAAAHHSPISCLPLNGA